MSKEKYLITRLSNRKPISLEKIKTKQKEDGVFFNYDETMISQIIEARENKEFEFVCSQIQNFIEENNIDTCFVINKDELIDCLQEHQKLKIQITNLQSQLAEKDQQISELQKQLKSQPAEIAEIVEKIRKLGQKHYNWVGKMALVMMD